MHRTSLGVESWMLGVGRFLRSFSNNAQRPTPNVQRPKSDARRLTLGVFAVLSILAMRAHAGTVITADGAMHEGEITLDRGVTLRGSPTLKLTLAAILRVRLATPNPQLQPGVLLVNGGRIAGAFSPLHDVAVKFAAKRIVIPSKEIAWAIYRPLPPALAMQAPRGKTGALLPGGDFFEGAVRSADAATAKVLNPIFGPRTFAGAEIQALVLRDFLPQAAAFEVVTRDGSIYPALDVITGDGAEITLRHALYNGLRIPVADIVEIRAGASRMVPMDGFQPTRIDPAPNRDAATSFAANRALGGGELKLGISPVAAGFECAAGAAIWWKAPGAGTFSAIVAASAETPAGQKLTFSVYADGKLAGRSAPLGADDPPAVLRCAVPGADSLVLRIEGAAGSGTWAEPMLLRR